MTYPVYTKTDWVQGVTDVDEPNMDHIEQGIKDNNDAIQDLDLRVTAGSTPPRLDEEALLITDWNAALDNGWYRGEPGTNAPTPFAGTLVIGRVERAEGFITQTVWQYATDNALAPTEYRRRYDGDWGPWISLAASTIEYENVWSSAVAYQPGDVVVHDGVEYLCVNANTNQTPPARGGKLISTYWGPLWPYAALATGVAFALGQLRGTRVILPQAISTVQFDVVTAGAASVFRVGVYQDTPTGPGGLLYQTANMSGAAVAIVSAALAVPAGTYWFAVQMVVAGGSPALRVATDLNPNMPALAAPAANVLSNAWQLTGQGAALPNPWPAGATRGGSGLLFPALFVQAT